ncbi:MAG: phosphoribulokinase [Methanoregulaceae archaeon]|nr:phosphoribulokinase [Methanoregulaceae archaeon]
MTGRLKFREIITSSPGRYAIGVAGDSGSGKTTFTESIRHIFGDSMVTTITLDDYHIYNRAQRDELQITPLHPDANNLAGLERDLRLLKQGKGIYKNIYNHSTGRLEGPEYLPPAKIIILEGLHSLYSPGLRDLLDFSLYLDPASVVKQEWKIKRDMEKRGYSEREVREAIERRENDYRAYIAPQRDHADAVIEIGFSRFGRDLGWKKNIYHVSILQTATSSSTDRVCLGMDLVSLMHPFDHDFMVEYRVVTEAGRKMGRLAFDGGIPRKMAVDVRRHIEEQTGIRPSDLFGGNATMTATDMVRLIVSWRIINQLANLA